MNTFGKRLKKNVLSCRKCSLRSDAIQVVYGNGSESPDILWIGEAPGAEEDRQGIPFVGRSGTLLRGYLASAPLSAYQHFITNIVKCRPPRNRNPRISEVASCKPHLLQQVQLLRPLIVVTLGNYAFRALMGLNIPITKCHGKRYEWNGISLFPLYHPAYLLYRRNSSTDFKKDLQKISRWIKKHTNNDEK